MKKLLFTALIAVSTIASAFASPVEKVSDRIKGSFNSNYPDISNVKWDMTTDYAKATFVIENVTTEAFYSHNGEFIGTSQAISINDLPTGVKRSFAKRYGNYTVKEAIQFEGKEESAYYISAENEKQSVILKAVNGVIEVFRSSNK
jgi:hypothetical protein